MVWDLAVAWVLVAVGVDVNQEIFLILINGLPKRYIHVENSGGELLLAVATYHENCAIAQK